MLNSTNHTLFLLLLLFLISVPRKCLASDSDSPVHGRTFNRPDPLRHFKDYNGDFDVRNKHYLAVSWSLSNFNTFFNSLFVGLRIWDWFLSIGFWCFQSAAFTGVHGYSFAGVWLLFGLVLGIFIIVKCLSGATPSLQCLDHYYIHILFLLLMLTSLAL